MKGLFLIAVNVRTRMFKLSGIDYLDTPQTLGSYIKVSLEKQLRVVGTYLACTEYVIRILVYDLNKEKHTFVHGKVSCLSVNVASTEWGVVST